MQSIVTNRVAWSVVRSVTLVSPAKRPNWSRCRFGWGLGWAQGTIHRWGQDPPWEGQFLGKKCPLQSIRTFCHELCKIGWTDGFAGCLTLLEILKIYWNYFSSWKSTGNLQSLLEIFWFSLRVCAFVINISYNSCISVSVPGSNDIEVSNLSKCQLTHLLSRW